MDLLRREVRRGGEAIDLQPREFQLLEFLLRHAGQVVTRTMLLEGRLGLSLRPANQRDRRPYQPSALEDRSRVRTAFAAHGARCRVPAGRLRVRRDRDATPYALAHQRAPGHVGLRRAVRRVGARAVLFHLLVDARLSRAADERDDSGRDRRAARAVRAARRERARRRDRGARAARRREPVRVSARGRARPAARGQLALSAAGARRAGRPVARLRQAGGRRREHTRSRGADPRRPRPASSRRPRHPRARADSSSCSRARRSMGSRSRWRSRSQGAC